MSYKNIMYLDNTSTNPIDPEILDTYTKLLKTYYANSGAIHGLGREVNRLHEKSRQEIIKLLNLVNYRLLFTSGATEANNTAIKSVALANQDRGKHLITTNIEHPSVHNSFQFLEQYCGFEVSYLDVDQDGNIDLEELKRTLRPDTVLVSIMNVNNEVGTIINPSEWTRLVKENSSAFTHSDMVQALGNIPLQFEHLDMASFSAHKVNGVKGSGFLIIRDHIKLAPLLSGGDQEYGLRAGTENAPANIVLAKTVRLALERQAQKTEQLKQLNKYLYEQLKLIPEVRFNSSETNSVYNIVNISVMKVGSEIMLNALSEKKMYVSAGSTCQSDVHKRSRVLMSMQAPMENQETRIRISLNTDLKKQDIDILVTAIKEIVMQYAI